MASGGRKSGTIFILIALVLVIILAVAAYMFKDQIFPQQAAQNLPTAQAVETEKVVILIQPVALGGVITEAALTTVDIPKDKNLVEGLFYKDPADVVGKIARYPLQQGIIITPGLLSEAATGGYAANQIPAGYVAISIPISKITAVSYGITAGDHVSVITSLAMIDVVADSQSKTPDSVVATNLDGTVVFSGTEPLKIPQGEYILDPVSNQYLYVIQSEDQRPRQVSQTLISDAIVLWVGEFPEPGVDPSTVLQKTAPTATPIPADGTQEQTAAPVEEPDADMITLVVSPQDAVTLNYLVLSGAKLNLALRSAGDTQKIETEAVTLQFIMDQYRIPLPSKLPYATEPRIDTLLYPGETAPIDATATAGQ